MSQNYEELRKKNIEDNKKILAELGLLNPFNPLPKIKKNKIVKKPKEDKPKENKSKYYIVTDEDSKPEDVGNYGSVYNAEGRTRSTRSSSRLRGKKIDLSDAMLDKAYEEAEEEMEEQREKRRVLGNRPMVYGPIPGVEVGTWWATRMECNHDGIHRPTVAGISGGPKGAYSIALSGGYEDDIDMGDCFTYTGEGGRDLKGTSSAPKNLRTAPQSKDQTLSRGNMALKESSETNFPIRVIRGYKSDSPFAPEEGYRYDGLYKCEKAWYTTGMAGYGVWKFALRRVEDQAPPPWTIEGQENAKASESADTDAGTKEEPVDESEKDVKDEVKEEMKTEDEDTDVKKEEVKDEDENPEVKAKVKLGKKKASKEEVKEEDVKIEAEEEDKEEKNSVKGVLKSQENEKDTKTKEKAKKRKTKPSDSEDEEDLEDEPVKKKAKKETKKDKKEKENASMSKGLMGWLVKTP